MKKIMKPFSTPVLAKRTYRELKLLKHIRHENVSCIALEQAPKQVPNQAYGIGAYSLPQIITLSDIFISPLEDM